MAVSVANDDVFPSQILGNPDGEVLVLLAGFPDDLNTGFAPLLDDLAKDYFIINLCMPGLEHRTKRRRWGYDFDRLLEMMDNTIKRLAGERLVSLVIHDWGALIGMLYENQYPTRVKRLVVMDVGILHFPDLRYVFHILLYQVTFAISYMVSQLVCLRAGNVLFKGFLALCYVCKPLLAPTPHDVIHRPFHHLHVEMCYPYFYLYMHYVCGRLIMPTFPTAPVLFLYGTQKNVMYHNAAFLRQLDATVGCRQVGLECGHWVQYHETATVLAEIQQFLH